jgi:replication initiation protein RepC
MDTVQRVQMAACRPTGLRKLTPKMLGTIEVADTHTFTSEMKPGQALAAFKAAAPYLGYRPSIVHAIDLLFRFTNPIDWSPSSRPIVWPAAETQQRELGLGASQVKNLNRHLVELGLVAMKDSPNGKRYGRRGPQGQIVEAYGFDLSPIASRYEEFQAVAQAGRDERTRTAALRRRATVARNGIRQLLQTSIDQRMAGDAWEAQKAAVAAVSPPNSASNGPHELEIAVSTLEGLQAEIRRALALALGKATQSEELPLDQPVDIGPKGPEDRPHITTTNQILNPKDTVVAREERRPVHFGALRSLRGKLESGTDRVANPCRAQNPHRMNRPEQLKIAASEVGKLAPRLAPYLKNGQSNWPEVVEAAEQLREELGISKYAWGDACVALGRELTATAVAIVSTKPQNHFRTSAGAYFHGMISRAKTGDLHLGRTLWALRNRNQWADRC